MTYDTLEKLVNDSLEMQVNSLGDIPETLKKAMLYSLEAGGKRLRPVLLLAAYGLLHEDVTPALPYACALEMIHTYSLIHDDLPAMDNDDLRRGKPTNHKMFGEAVAILAGDGLLNAAYELMLRTASQESSLSGLRAAEVIARRAGVTGMIAGQTLDVTLEGTEPTLEKVAYIHAHKTADLLTAPWRQACCWLGHRRSSWRRDVLMAIIWVLHSRWWTICWTWRATLRCLARMSAWMRRSAS